MMMYVAGGGDGSQERHPHNNFLLLARLRLLLVERNECAGLSRRNRESGVPAACGGDEAALALLKCETSNTENASIPDNDIFIVLIRQPMRRGFVL